jgi:hypothetical protein
MSLRSDVLAVLFRLQRRAALADCLQRLRVARGISHNASIALGRVQSVRRRRARRHDDVEDGGEDVEGALLVLLWDEGEALRAPMAPV